MSLEIKNLSISVKIETNEKENESTNSLKEDVLRECKQLIEDSIKRDRER